MDFEFFLELGAMCKLSFGSLKFYLGEGEFGARPIGCLKVQSCKLYNSKYMIASRPITNTEIFTFIAVLVFKLLSRKVLFINRKGNRNNYKK